MKHFLCLRSQRGGAADSSFYACVACVSSNRPLFRLPGRLFGSLSLSPHRCAGRTFSPARPSALYAVSTSPAAPFSSRVPLPLRWPPLLDPLRGDRPESGPAAPPLTTNQQYTCSSLACACMRHGPVRACGVFRFSVCVRGGGGGRTPHQRRLLRGRLRKRPGGGWRSTRRPSRSGASARAPAAPLTATSRPSPDRVQRIFNRVLLRVAPAAPPPPAAGGASGEAAAGVGSAPPRARLGPRGSPHTLPSAAWPPPGLSTVSPCATWPFWGTGGARWWWAHGGAKCWPWPRPPTPPLWAPRPRRAHPGAGAWPARASPPGSGPSSPPTPARLLTAQPPPSPRPSVSFQ